MMECQDIRLLLAFTQRKSEDLDAGELTHVNQHLEKCPDCAAVAQGEHAADQALGALMRDVPIPADLQQKVMKRLAAERRTLGGWLKGAAVAAAVVLLIAGGTAFFWRPLPSVTFDDVSDLTTLGLDKNIETVNAELKRRGLEAQAPTKLGFEFDYRYLQQVDVVEFKGRRVAKLSFYRPDDGAGMALAEVLILPHKQFRVEELGRDQDMQGTISIRIRHVDEFTYLISSRGEFATLLHRAVQ